MQRLIDSSFTLIRSYKKLNSIILGVMKRYVSSYLFITSSREKKWSIYNQQSLENIRSMWIKLSMLNSQFEHNVSSSSYWVKYDNIYPEKKKLHHKCTCYISKSKPVFFNYGSLKLKSSLKTSYQGSITILFHRAI